MICLDTTFLVDLWRNKADPDHSAVQLLREHAAEILAVPAHVAGEFLHNGNII